jgi:hypothetical protein
VNGSGFCAVSSDPLRHHYSCKQSLTIEAIIRLATKNAVLNAPPGTAGVTDARRDEMAKAAAPYLHQKSSSLELTGADEGPVQYSMDLTKLSDEELMAFERILPVLSPPLLELDPVGDRGGTLE